MEKRWTTEREMIKRIRGLGSPLENEISKLGHATYLVSGCYMDYAGTE